MKWVAGKISQIGWIHPGIFRRSNTNPENITAGMKLTSSAIWLARN